MSECKYDSFVIMPINNPDTEFLWSEVYQPVLKSLGFDPKRAKENEDGSEMTGQIRNFVSSANLLIADLTLARPNCYYEVGLAMGANRESNLILCCRKEDKIHFDVSTYYVIRWNKDNLESFRNELSEKIELRKPYLKPILIEDQKTSIDSVFQDIRSMSKKLDEIKAFLTPIERRGTNYPTFKIDDFRQRSIEELSKWKKTN